MKGASPGVWQARFYPQTGDAAKSITLGTATKTIPTVMTSAPGNANDYWLKISSIGTLRPQVIGTSGTFTITGVTGGTPATLTINTDSTGKSSLITIIDNSNGKEVFPGFSTPHPYSLPGGSYTITLSRSCTIPMVPQVITLGSGAVVTKTYPLTDVSANDCKNDISTAEFGSIDITSLPDNGYSVFLKRASEPDTRYEYIGSETPTIWNVLPGDWTVKLEAVGYMPGVQNVHVDGGDTANVHFTLKKIDVDAQVLIVPQPLNIGRTGYFLAFVKLPTGNKAADVDAGKVYCEGAKALKVIRINLFPQIFVAIFQRQDLVPYVLPKDKVTLHVTGEIKKSTGNLVFMGSNTIKVISQKSTTKEDCDNVMSMTDTQIFTKFNKF